MSFSQHLKHFRYLPHYKNAVEALSALGAARMDLLTCDASDREARWEAFSQQQQRARAALRPLADLTPQSVGAQRYFEHWIRPLAEHGDRLTAPLAVQVDQQHLRGFHFGPMLAPDYVPTAEPTNDPALNWRRFGKAPPSGRGVPAPLTDADLTQARLNEPTDRSAPAGPG